MPFRRQKTSYKIITTIAVSVTLLIITLIITSAWEEYAIVGYNLSSPDWAFSNEQLKVNFNIKNSGKVDVVPEIIVTVENATIEKIEIPNVAEYQLSSFCSYDNSCAKFTNLKLSSDWDQLGVWSSIYILPKEGVASFKINATVNLPYDFFHPKNEVTRILPWEFIYTSSDGHSFEKLI